MVSKLAEVAAYCQSLAATTGNSFAGAVREFLNRYTVRATALTTGYYAQYTAPKNWDAIMTDLWKCIPSVSDPTQRYPHLLCYDYTDLIIMICAQMGIEARSVRCAASFPFTRSADMPAYLDHEYAEVWTGSKWAAQDGFYNVEFLLGPYTFASSMDLCAAKSLDEITPRNKPLATGVVQTGWGIGNIDAALKQQDFYAALEYRDHGGVLQPVVNGASPQFAGAGSVVVMNTQRGNFTETFRNPANGVQKTLRQFMLDYTAHPRPACVEF